MPISDIVFVTKWWLMFFILGSIFLPLTTILFSNFFDKGYIFAKIIGIVIVSYIVFVLGILKVLPFTFLTITLTIAIFAILNIVIFRAYFKTVIPDLIGDPENMDSRFRGNDARGFPWKIFLFEEILFFLTLFFWSYIRAHSPDIHGLEKYMDFGFINSIIRSEHFPPHDMWFTPHPINYYYFGHLVTAVLTKLSQIPSFITFNLMVATIFAFTFTCAFSIGANLWRGITLIKTRNGADQRLRSAFISGLLTAFLVSIAGNLHTIYAFFKPYPNENPVPFWQLAFSPQTFQNSYWYPNATRFIHNTIHEFPIYSSVVSDLHGHVLDIPFVLVTIAILLSLIFKFHPDKVRIKFQILPISFLLAVMYMTNAWDGIIYFLLSAIIIVYIKLRHVANIKNPSYIIPTALYLILILTGFFVFSLPFNLSFKPFASGIGILCAPEFLTKIARLGPFLFEANHCQHSPIWQLLILYGFFYFWAISFIFFLFKKLYVKHYTLYASDIFILILIFLSTLLILLPEFIYIKDIYPAHYRANTMFKLVYQSFIMLSIVCGYIIVRIASGIKYRVLSIKGKIFAICYLLFAICLIFLVMIYPFFAINSYYGNLKTYYGLNGTQYLRNLYPTDYQGILWINKNIKGQPVILEAQGDSYTDYGRISTNTGLPTVLGWTVHEWLWRGTYDIPAPRIPEVQNLYEANDTSSTKQLINKYHISLVFIGDLERQKYPKLNEEKFKVLGKIIYQNRNTKIYKLNI